MKRRLWPHYLVLIVVAFLLLAPIVATLIYSFTTSWVRVLPSGWTLKSWHELITEQPVFWQSIVRSFIISVIPILITILIIIMAMYVVVLYVPALDTVIQSICMIRMAMLSRPMASAVGRMSSPLGSTIYKTRQNVMPENIIRQSLS